jgi:hypothetical protein
MSGIYYYGAFMRDGLARVSRAEPDGQGHKATWLPSVRPDAPPFEWGVESPGAVELSYSILFDATGNEITSEIFALAFADEIVSQLPRAGFVLDVDQVREWLRLIVDQALDLTILGANYGGA